MVRFGAILSQGIIDAGGRNATISLQSRSGYNNRAAVVGIFVFLQYWYWFPMCQFLCLSFTPTCLIVGNGTTEDASIEKVEFIAKADPPEYKYPPALETKKKGDKSRIATAILSTTARQRKKDADKTDKKDGKDDEGEEPGPPEPFEYKDTE